MGVDGVKNTMSWVIGLSTIALVLLVTLIIFGNLSGNTGITTTTKTTFTNESCFVNETGYQPIGVTRQGFMSYVVNQIGGNYSGNYYVIPALNYTSALGDNKIYNATTLNFAEYGYTNAGCSYTATYRSGEYNQAENVITNYSSGVGKLINQVPTILLFVGIALLLVVLVGVLAWVLTKLGNLGGSQKGRFE